MKQAVTAVLYSPGTNCHEETAAAIELAGGRSEFVLLHDLLKGQACLRRYQAAVIPGGFSYGDHLGAGRIFATLLVAQLREQLVEFLGAGRPLLGVCNGFQVLTEAGILPQRKPGERTLALVTNTSAHFEDRNVRLLVAESECVWTAGLAGHIVSFPSAHGEGRPLLCATGNLNSLKVAFRYCDASGNPTQHYPENPNGAPEAIAGITDESGLVLGLMPHPERAFLPAHRSQDGYRLFQNLVRYLGQ